MKRREFITLLGGVAVGGTVAGLTTADAEQADTPYRLGLVPIGSSSNRYDQSLVEAFLQGLRQVGLIENRNVTVDITWVHDETEFPRVMRELVQRGARVLIPAGTSAAVAAKRQTATIPIVFITVGDPIGVGLVESLSHPGGNATGFSDVLLDLSGKFVELARQVGNRQSTIDYLWYAGWANGPSRFQATERAAQSAGVALRAQTIGDVAQARDIIAAMKNDGAVALIIQPGPFMYRHRVQLVKSALDQGVATIFGWPEAAREGALIGYGPDYADIYRRAPIYVDRILKGAQPADLPVEQPAKFQLVLNLKTAKALGLEMPSMLLATADEVVE
jgi:putative tryptophan/tyrosine transport system substrate-binding protein